jgi:hypothetical protein
MIWSVAFAVIVLALLIPILAFALDAPFFKRWRGSQLPPSTEEETRLELLARRLLNLEDEVDDLSHTVRELQDELQYVQRVFDTDRASEASDRLEPPKA